MGAFFTNIQIRGGDPKRIREVILAELRDAGMHETDGDTFDRELLIVPGPRWTAVYDLRAENQDATATDWARMFSAALATDAFSVLVHDSDVLDLALFASGKKRDHYDSNPGFSGQAPSKVTPAARAAKWEHLLADGHTRDELAAVFEHRGVFAEGALAPLAAALGIEHGLLATGYNYTTHDGDPPPASLVRVRGVLSKRPAWERRLGGPPRFASIWERFGASPPAVEPQRVLEGQPVHLSAQLTNNGGAATGMRIEIATTGDAVSLERIEVVISRSGQKMARHPAPLVRAGDLLVADFADVGLMPGAAAGLDTSDAPMCAMMDAHHAGNIHLNVHGRTCRPGRADLAIRCIPLSNPKGAYVAPIVVEVQAVRGAPLRTGDELHPYMLDRLTGDDHTYLLVLFDTPAAEARTHARTLLEALRFVWPKGAWTAFASDKQFEVGDQIEARGGLGDTKVWSALTKAIATVKYRVTATCAPLKSSYDTIESSGFELQVKRELPTLALSLAKAKVPHDRAAEILIPIIDALARDRAIVQAVLARWKIESLSTDTPYEDVVGIHGGPGTARRDWATRYLRAVGPGQLWLGPALADRAAALPLADVVALGPSRRLTVTDVAATEQILASLLPTRDEYREFSRSLPDDDDE